MKQAAAITVIYSYSSGRFRHTPRPDQGVRACPRSHRLGCSPWQRSSDNAAHDNPNNIHEYMIA
jgi:hypothetical protein